MPRPTPTCRDGGTRERLHVVKVDPDGAGFDAERLERITEHFDQRYVATGKIAGCQIAVVRRGSLAYWRSLGLMDRERSKPVEDDTIWRIYSMTKPLTSVALMQLYEQGLFQLNDPIHRYIEEWRDLSVGEFEADGSVRKIEPVRPMNVRDALTHMTGLAGSLVPGHPTDDDFAAAVHEARHGMTLERVCTLLAGYPLKFQPGTRWNYGLSTDICARLVEILSGEPFDRYLQAHIFEPLGMVDTGFSVPDASLDRFAACYRYRPGTTTGVDGGPRTKQLSTSAFLPLGCRRPGVDHSRLPPLLPEPGRRRGARRAPGHRPQDPRAHDLQPPPR